MAKIIKFRPRPIGDAKPIGRDEPCLVLILPVIRIERHDGPRAPCRGPAKRRKPQHQRFT